MPTEPLLIFDGRCGFCRIWIDYWKQLTGSRVDYAPSQEAGKEYPQIPPEKFSQAVQLVMPGGEVLEGAKAVFATLTYVPGMAWLLWMYDHLPGFAPLTEAGYRLIARNRSFFYPVTRLTFGRRISVLRYSRIEWLFLRLLACIYLIAFASLAVQIIGLIGARGILPIGTISGGGTANLRRAGVLAGAGHFLVRAFGRIFTGCVRGRSSDLNGVTAGLLRAPIAGLPLYSLSLAVYCRPRLPCRSSGTFCCSKLVSWRSFWEVRRSWCCCSAGCCSG